MKLILPFFAATALLAQHTQHGAVRPAPRAKAERGPGGMGEAPKRASDQQITKLQKMTAEERQKTLETLPPERRVRVENRLEKLQKMSPEQRSQLQDRLDRFNRLAPAQQKEVRQLAKQVAALPDDRRPAVKHELEALRNLPEEKRNTRLASPEFKSKYSVQEQEILKNSSALLPDQF